MGFFDYLIIDKTHLPDELKSHEVGWQTKSHERGLNTLKITKDGSLMISYDTNPDMDFNPYDGSVLDIDPRDTDMEFLECDFTGTILFHQAVRNISVEYYASFIEGILIELKRV